MTVVEARAAPSAPEPIVGPAGDGDAHSWQQRQAAELQLPVGNACDLVLGVHKRRADRRPVSGRLEEGHPTRLARRVAFAPGTMAIGVADQGGTFPAEDVDAMGVQRGDPHRLGRY